jgi:hypothetical protein
MNTINEKNVAKLVRQFTLHNLTTERVNIIGQGWTDIKIDPDFKEKSIDQIINILGGHQKTKDRIKFVIKNTPISGWYSDRIVFEPAVNRWVYIAGQDHPKEINEIRNDLKK